MPAAAAQNLDRVFSALADPTRRAILARLATGEATVNELVEPFGAAGRVGSPFCYWMLVAPASRGRSEVVEFSAWVEAQAAATRAAVESGGRAPPRPATAAASARPAR